MFILLIIRPAFLPMVPMANHDLVGGSLRGPDLEEEEDSSGKHVTCKVASHITDSERFDLSLGAVP